MGLGMGMGMIQSPPLRGARVIQIPLLPREERVTESQHAREERVTVSAL